MKLSCSSVSGALEGSTPIFVPDSCSTSKFILVEGFDVKSEDITCLCVATFRESRRSLLTVCRECGRDGPTFLLLAGFCVSPPFSGRSVSILLDSLEDVALSFCQPFFCFNSIRRLS